jgi:organic radical activating enzyme
VALPITGRLDANLGYQCNSDCLFCYFGRRKRRLQNPTTAEAKKALALVRGLGKSAVDMTGGEPTLRGDILELITYAKKELGFRNITIITNGSRFCDRDFAAEAIGRGVDDVLVSLHGHDAGLHDRLTGRGGSFDEAVRTIRNVAALGAECRTNTVINGLNFARAPEIAEAAHESGARKANFLLFCPLDDASAADAGVWARYSQAAPHIMRMIDGFGGKFGAVSVKAMPFCFLEGYEEYVTDFFQNTYDPYEWDYYLRVRLRRGRLTSDLAAYAGMALFMGPGRVRSVGWQGSLREGIMRLEAHRHFTKPEACRQCAFGPICPGVWKRYAELFGLSEIKPIRGEKVWEADMFMHRRFPGVTRA